ncbi:MAG TPA: OmpA family protein [Stellaceae bacterium]|nr:OmpA family protein [Stellaceae bacterium]
MRRYAIVALAALVPLGGCSWVPDAVNPVAWYRDLSGASKNDALDKNQPDQKRFDAGGKEPYPNLASVPGAPDNALSTIERDKLEKGLVADRANAKYTGEHLEAGMPVNSIVPPPPPAAPSPAAAAPSAAPASPGSPRSSQGAPHVSAYEAAPKKQPTTPVTRTATLAPPAAPGSSGPSRRVAPPASAAVVAIAFTSGSTALSDAEKARLSAVAAMQHRDGGTLRVIGHAPPPGGDDAMQKDLDSFNLALERAKAVASTLGADGVPPEAIAVEAAPTRADDAAAASAEVYLVR